MGAHLGYLVTNGHLKLPRGLASLTELHRAGAHPAVWATASSALAVILAAPEPVRGTPDLLAVASQVAAAQHARGSLPALTQAAQRPGTGRLVTEAKRLHRILTAAP